MTIGLYVHADTPVHRLPPGVKIASLAVFGTTVFLLSDRSLLLGCLGAVLVLYAVARIPWAQALSQARPALWLLLAIFAVQALVDGWAAGVATVLRFGTLILLAALVTMTTRASAMIEALESGLHPLARLGIDPGKVSLALSLALRFIPVVAAVTGEVREAQNARGLNRSIVALVVPVVVRTLKMADDVADAIEARSYGSRHHPPRRPAAGTEPAP